MILPIFYIFLVIVCILPIAPGVLGVLSASLSYMPSIGLSTFSLDGYLSALEWSGVSHSIFLTLTSAFVSTFVSCIVAFAILQATWQQPVWKKVEPLLSPLLAMPHVAFAIGFAFLFSPTGMIARLLNPFWVFEFPVIINDAANIGLILVLIIKEVPFLLLMSIPIMQQLQVDKSERVAASLGYQRHQIWWKCIFPQWLRKARFPILAVIAYSVSVVDVSLILGSTNPPTFAVLVWQWFSDPDIQLQPRAAAGAMILLLLCLLLIGLHRFLEWGITQHCRHWQISGRVGIRLPGLSLFVSLSGIVALSLPIMMLWSASQRWRFPNLLPTQFTLRFWESEWTTLFPVIADSIIIAVISSSLALIFALLGHEYKLKYRWHIPSILIAVPMLIPQLSLLFGIQVSALYFSSDSYWLWVIWAHVFFAFPYVFLALDGPWRSFDQRLTQTGLSLGKSPLQCWIKIKLPLLLPAILYAWAVGISVSLAQYLPTQMLGAGRIMTLTTEAVALSSGFDRRITALYGLWQALLPFVFFSLALFIGRHYSRRSHLNSTTRKVMSNESINNKSQHTHS
ncbi:thiamine ABC transporter permease [Aliivibrio finisterrensis]|uniref:Thiamine ABC transporter permease n=1 Tax=Aliivibrio finisterrensis TaxID=511998 RepID=A0A4Q5KXE9_9GAMM|nr:thiamine ABC transporter permease [Aliivibrio finisterrensis]RYU53758.1 thiamine ABC transporter permease [Aliivibrio finisterrensis]RYU58890.1 thiamine ABC transporter permease [Aliivibrio finisterrensis]RYU64441.1 thiamine ABC transporter permease [Aliivibrio finisterrensis]RYU84682.1 thiamine ABC transporter permease [Aliivibrio finisterrensis]